MGKSRNDANSTDEQVKLYSATTAEPPAHVYLRAGDLPFWDSIMAARAADTWTPADLEFAANLARCKADTDRLQREIDTEGDFTGDAINLKHKLLDKLTRRAIALSRLLHVHACATQGRSRDTGARTRAQHLAQAGRSHDTLIPH